jgi:hypothetical protein
MSKSFGDIRLAICECGERIVPTGVLGTCWEHEKTRLNRCGYDDMGHATWAKPAKVLERGWKPRRKPNKGKANE